MLPGGTWPIKKRMVSRGTAVLVAAERRKLGFISKRQRKLPSAAPWHQRNVFGRISSALLYLIRVLVDRAFYAHRMAFARRLRILILLDAQFIREMWAHTFDQKTLLNGNMSYRHFGSR